MGHMYLEQEKIEVERKKWISAIWSPPNIFHNSLEQKRKMTAISRQKNSLAATWRNSNVDPCY